LLLTRILNLKELKNETRLNGLGHMESLTRILLVKDSWTTDHCGLCYCRIEALPSKY
ncbi:hypothetical protein ACH5RR_023498, partial [Cinchona calisaya]